MASAANNDSRAPDFTEAVVTLQQTIQKFIRDVRTGHDGFVLRPVASTSDEADQTYTLSITSPDKEIETHLNALEAQLQALERQLRSRGDWKLPDQIPESSTPAVLDVTDLSNAVMLLGHLIDSTKPTRQDTPQQALSAHSWTWDPAWHEFYTYIPSEQTYVYLSRWRLNELRNVWEHVSMAGVSLMPDIAAEMLGAWEDWIWDSTWKQWYLEVDETDTGEKIHIFASPWRVQRDDEWVYVGRTGSVN